MKLCKFAVAALLLLLSTQSTVHAATKWWDLDGANPGVGNVGGFQDGTWDTTLSNWSTSAAGDVAATTFVAGDDVVFNAGDDNTNDGFITVTGTQTVNSLLVEDGKIAIIGGAGAITLGANPWKVTDGAMLRLSNLNQVSIVAGNILTLDNGTISNNIIGVGSGIISSLGKIQLGSGGGTVNTPNGGPTGTDTDTSAYNILVYNNTIEMATGVTGATLHKTGHGEFRALNNWTFTALDIQEGLYRINGTGGGDTGFGAATGTVTIAGGAVENTSKGAAIGTSLGITSPNTRSFVLSGVGATLDCAITLSASWVINGNISGAGGFILNGWQRGDAGAAIGTAQTLTLNGTNTYGGGTTIGYGTIVAGGGNAIPNTSRVSISTRSLWGNGTQSTQNTAVLQIGTSATAATETIGSLSGGNATRGSVNILNAASVLITGGNDETTTYSGAITGAGGLSKSGNGTFTMDGVKTYTGGTKVLGGTLSTNSASLADAADVSLTTGAFFNLNFAGTDTINSLFIDSVLQSAGVWGAIGSGAAHETARITGTGFLNAVVGPAVGIPGDYNSDGKVDAQDYVLWRKTPASYGGDPGGYTTWRANFSSPPGAGSGGGLGAAAVPEPGTLVLAIFGLAMAAVGGRRR